MWDPRAAFDTLLQSATVDLFHNCGVAVAPLPRSVELRPISEEHLACTLRFSGPHMNGNMALAVPRVIVNQARHDGPVPSGPSWVAEVANQLLGRLKKRLTQFQVDLHSGLPVALTLSAFARHRERAKDPVTYPFRTISGEILVVMDGVLNYSALSYSGAVKLANEGDIILF